MPKIRCDYIPGAPDCEADEGHGCPGHDEGLHLTSDGTAYGTDVTIDGERVVGMVGVRWRAGARDAELSVAVLEFDLAASDIWASVYIDDETYQLVQQLTWHIENDDLLGDLTDIAGHLRERLGLADAEHVTAIQHDPNPPIQKLPETSSDSRMHVVDESCWCDPTLDDAGEDPILVHHSALAGGRCSACGHRADEHGPSGCAADDEAAMGGCDCTERPAGA